MGWLKTVARRFAFVYFLLYISPWPLATIGLDVVADAYSQRFDALAKWVGHALLGLDGVTRHPTGSGDTLIDWLTILVVAILSVAIVAVWTTADRARTAHPRLHEALRVILRFYLAQMMLSYGLSKVWKGQFPMPWETRLDQPFGATTPMGLMWTFMGSSTAYTIFAGAAETLGGLLLFFRRTATLGALVVAGVMTNVFVLNLCYDVPVKQFAFHLLVMAVVIAAPELPRLAALLLRGDPGSRARRIVGLLFAAFLVQKEARDAHEAYHKWGDGKPPLPSYRVEAMEPPLWKKAVLDVEIMNVLYADDSIERWRMWRDDASRLIYLSEVNRPPALHVLRIESQTPDTLALAGTLRGTPIRVTLRRYEPQPSRLKSQEFRWISEYPNNH